MLGVWKHGLAVLLWLTAVQVTVADFAFVHPGLLQSRQDLVRLKRAVANKEEPIYSGYLVFRTNAESQINYRIRGPLPTIGRNPTVGQNAYDSDASAAYQLAIMWSVTGNIGFANKSKEIVDVWSARLKSVTGCDAVLMAGLGPFKMVNAAEILRYTDCGWSPGEIQQAEENFREVIYPVIKDFAPFANGNWDSAAMKTVMAIGVFCNDRPMFERALHYYENGDGDGCLSHYIINRNGQCQESGRDQQHTQLGLAHLGDCCEIAWHQGLNLYGYDDDLLLRGFEYTAEYNLGGNVPFMEASDCTGKYHHAQISPKGRGHFRSVYEEIYNAYVVRLGISAPFTRQVIERIRPEGIGVPGAPDSADHVGFGTFLYGAPLSGQRPALSAAVPAAPGGVIADGSSGAIKLSWVAPVDAAGYTVKRAVNDGNYRVLSRNVSIAAYTDSNVTPGGLYRYTVSASSSAGESGDSYPVAVCAGLPKPWIHRNIGPVTIPGHANYDGNTLVIQGSGVAVGDTNDVCQFVGAPMSGDGRIIVRYVPQVSSQFSEFGLMLRDGLAADDADVALLVSPQTGRNIEAPDWRAELSSRESKGGDSTLRASSRNLAEPMVTHGRLTGYCWLSLNRNGNQFAASVSADGRTWTKIGGISAPLGGRLMAGVCVCSGRAGLETVIHFDHLMLGNASK